MRVASLAVLTAAFLSSTSSAFAGGCLHFLPFLDIGNGGGNSGGVPAPDAGPVLGMLVTAGIVALAHRRRRAAAVRAAG